jgi:hypothetical protein
MGVVLPVGHASLYRCNLSTINQKRRNFARNALDRWKYEPQISKLSATAVISTEARPILFCFNLQKSERKDGEFGRVLV